MDRSDDLTDEQLVARANAAGPDAADAFTTLYQRHRDYVLRIARRYSPDEAAALDATQETFLYLLRKFPPPPENRLTLSAKLTTLLFPVAKHNAMAGRRKSQRLRLVGDDSMPEPSVETETPPAIANEALASLLGSLSDGHREVVLLRFVDELSLAEIAERLEIPAGTVKSRLHHAIAKLRDDPATKNFFDP